MKNVRIFVSESKNGALAHLARALDWQSKGDEFESRMLHKSFYFTRNVFCKNDWSWAMQKFCAFV